MVYLVKDNGTVRAFYSEDEMTVAGFATADKTVTDEEFNGNGCYARIAANGGEIIVGRTEEEIAEEEKQEQITEIQARFNEIDRLDGPRPIREAVAQLVSSAGLDNSYLNRHEDEAESLRQQLAELKQSA